MNLNTTAGLTLLRNHILVILNGLLPGLLGIQILVVLVPAHCEKRFKL
jgi:hypothetical protein